MSNTQSALADAPARAPIPTEAAAATAAAYKRDGFVLVPDRLPLDVVARAEAAMDRQLAGINGIDVSEVSNLRRLQKYDNYHHSDPDIDALISHPLIGQWAAAVTGARKIQVFVTQMLYKPSGLEETGNVGWHQDLEYWDPNLVGNLFTAWIALSDVTADSGPMRFVPGTQRAGLLNAGDFFNSDLDSLQARIMEKAGMTEWHETAAILPPGGFSLHNKLTVHGSGPNTSGRPRKSFAVHLLTENAGFRPGAKYSESGYLFPLENLDTCPIIYQRED